MILPYSQYLSRVEALLKRAKASTNPLIPAVASLDKARRREFRVLVSFAMVRAAVEYRRRGVEGLDSVMDPCGTGPFAFKRFALQGVHRGFELQSAANDNGAGTLIFVEKAGVPFLVTGPRAGQIREPYEPKATEKAFQKRYGILPAGTNR
jgi:hypothetical protein